jgi:hypothetical protein
MSKGLKQILIVGIIIVVFGLGVIIMAYVFPDPNKANPDVSASPTASEGPVHYIIKEDGNDLVSIENIYPDGTTMLIEYGRDPEGKLTYKVTPDSEFFAYDTSKFRSMMFTLTSLTAIQKIEENPKDLSLYGLDNPQFTMKLSFNGGKVITLTVGNSTPVDMNFYVMTDDKNTVYTVGNYLGNLIMRTELQFRDIDVFPTYEGEEIYTNIDWVKLTKRDGTEIEVILDSDLSMQGNITSSNYLLLSPVVSSCNDENVQKSILDVVATLTYSGVVKDITKEEMAEYGFSRPARLQMRDVSGNQIDLTIGTVNDSVVYAAYTSQYEACLKGEVHLTLLSYTPSAFNWLDLNYLALMNRTVWIENIHNIESIDYNLNGDEYHMALREYDDITNSGVEVVRTVGTLNGKELSEDNTKRLYARTLNMRVINEIPDSVELGDPSYKITLNLRDGGKQVLEMIMLNERQYACVVNGTARFYVYTNNLKNLLYAFERLNDDRDIPLIYYT